MATTLKTTTCILALALSSAASAGTWSTAAWTNDATSGINTGGVYTHAYNFGNNATNAPATAINGVNFASAPGANPSAGNFTLTGYGSTFGVDGNNVTSGGSDDIANSFIYNGVNGTLTLTGLTANSLNTLNIYGVGFDTGIAREATFTNSAIPADTIAVDENLFGNNNGVRVQYDYTADVTGTAVIDIAATVSGRTFHLYGFANEITATQAAITGLFATGVDNSNAVLANGAADPHYTFISGPQSPSTNPQATVQANHPAWETNDTESKWIGVTSSGPNGVPPGPYIYEIEFEIGNDADLSTAEVTGLWWADDAGGGTTILLNGTDTNVPDTPNFKGQDGNAAVVDGTAFTITNGMGGASFVHGINTLRFLVENGGTSNNPHGLRVADLEGTYYAIVPEPSSLALLGLGGLALLRRRR